jgi:integrase
MRTAESVSTSSSDATRDRAAGPLEWTWPVSPRFFRVYDKYADVDVPLSSDDDTWIVPIRGRTQRYQFASGPDGALQRKLVMLTQAQRSPAAICKFARSTILHWHLYKELLSDGPSSIRQHWNERVRDIDTAKAAKAILRLACTAMLGSWRSAHLPVVKALDTRARSALLIQRGRIRRRELVLSIDTQAALARVLDDFGSDHDLTEPQAEGLTALALCYQHGMRPVQLLALRVEHVRLFRDASGDDSCVISFHSAKQREDQNYELIRQVKPEWASAVVQLFRFATGAGRRRLFACTKGDELWSRVRAVCAAKGVVVDFTAYALRHTAAQSLADGGHKRDSIRKFLGQTNTNAASTYLQASRQLSEWVNAALGASKLYANILSLAAGKFVSIDEMVAADADQQIGAVVGERLVAGVGLCRSGQSHCPYNPVTSCYGCSRFMPALDRTAHEEAIAGMREQILVYVNRAGGTESPAYLQLMRALAGAQQALKSVDTIAGVAK